MQSLFYAYHEDMFETFHVREISSSRYQLAKKTLHKCWGTEPFLQSLFQSSNNIIFKLEKIHFIALMNETRSHLKLLQGLVSGQFISLSMDSW